MRTSEQVDQLATALAAAQGEFTNPERNREVKVSLKSGGSYTFMYATFDCIMDMARPTLAKHGLSVLQSPSNADDGKVFVATRLLHSSGQWAEDTLSVHYDGGIQGLGGAITYLKRYAFCSMLGITAEEDDDGNHAAGNEVQTQSRVANTYNGKAKPNCPKCGKNDYVFPDKKTPGQWFCWKKPAEDKHGCGEQWTEGEQPRGEPLKPLDGEQSKRVATCLTEIIHAKAVSDLKSIYDAVITLPDGPQLWAHCKQTATKKREELEATPV